jgi:uncharacterized membrane protein YsdA (DUF1294 family)
MATCPLCRTKRNYPSLLFLGESRTLDCKQCGIFLRARADEARLLPYALITGSVAAILAFTVVLSGDFVATVSLLLAWTLISWCAYPFVLVLAADQRHALQSESK